MDETQMMVLELGSKGYSCAQIIIIGTLRLMGEENENLVRAMGGLAQGIGNTGNICGALAGGLCMLAMYTAKGNDFEQEMPKNQILMDELVSWFSDEMTGGKAITCDAILGIGDKNDVQEAEAIIRVMDGQRCGFLVAKIWEKCVNLLREYEIDPTMERAEV